MSSEAQTVTVRLGDRAYPIYIGSGSLRELGSRLKAVKAGGKAAVVTNETVGRLYLQAVEGSLCQAGFVPVALRLPDGEEHKNLAWLSFIYDRLISAEVQRSTPLVALGGGVVGDIGGFAAATLLRGLPLVQVPTTLLSQVDSSVGGKTAINHAAGKNLIGAFYQPRFVLIDVDTLKTLPKRELLAGLAEVVKYGAILDPELFALLEERLSAILKLDPETLVHVIKVCCQLKALVVEEDETESGYRAILNFGHTVGHGIEALTEYKRYLHGEAIAIGMVAAARVSWRLGCCDESVYRRLKGLLQRAGLPTEVPGDIDRDSLALVLRTDKKSQGDKIKFVCLEAIGQTRFEMLASGQIVKYL